MIVTDTASGDAAATTKQQVVVRKRGGDLQYIPFIHRLYEPLHYVLLFPYGEEGWHPDLRHTTRPAARHHAGEALAADEAEAEAAEAEAAGGDGQADTGSKRLTRLQYGAYRLMVRRGELNPILLSRRLGQEWIVGTYAALESSNLDWIRFHQKQLHTETFQVWHALQSRERPFVV